MSEAKEKVEQLSGMKPMTAEEREKYGLPPLKEEYYGLETNSKA